MDIAKSQAFKNFTVLNKALLFLIKQKNILTLFGGTTLLGALPNGSKKNQFFYSL